MWSDRLIAVPRFLALVMPGDAGWIAFADIKSNIGPVLLLIFLAGYAVKCFLTSDDRRVLAYKWAATAGIVFVILVLMFLGGRDPRLKLLFVIPCVILSFVWLPSVVRFALKPLTGAFDGGDDEVEPKPFYFIAAAKRKKGLHQEAADEVRKQLEKFPGDFEGSLLLATIQAEDQHDLPAAHATIDELLEQSSLTPQQVTTALHTLADWQLQARNTAAARKSLERIVARFPDTQFAHAAEQRIAHLEDFVTARDFRENARFEVRQRERDVGLRSVRVAEPESSDPDELAAQFVNHLESHPTDTDTREKLAVLYAEHFQRLDLAVDQLEQLISLPEETPKHVARWLNLMATLHIGVARDETAARIALQRIVEKFPKSAMAEVAKLRLANLRGELKAGTAVPVKALGNYEKDLGLKP